ncbi:MAG: associated Golgi protein [Phycisphaerales bacterium]|nr:associated Golgi protein [Phycisphaerales bacterium]
MDDVTAADSPTATVNASPPVGAGGKFKAFLKRLGPAGPLALLAATFPPIGGFVLIGLVYRIAPWLREHRGPGLMIYVGGFAVLAALSILPTYACSILGGWAFGFAIGFPASMIAFCSASLLSYLINALAAGDRVVEIVREHPKWEAVRVALLGCGFWKAFWIITLLRLPPYSPFAAANFILGTTRAPLVPFLLATLVGMAPRTAAVVWAAAHASKLDFKDSTQIWIFVGGLLVTLVVIGVIGEIANKAVKRVTTAQPQQSQAR